MASLLTTVPRPFFPPPLPAGGTIGVVAPSCHAPRAWLRVLEREIKKRGYRAVVHEQCFLKDGTLAGSDEARAAAVMDLFRDPQVGAIFCARGGTGATRVMERLDYAAIARQAKPFVGFSDMTALLNALTGQTGMVTFHGPMGWNFLPENADSGTENALFDALSGPFEGARIPLAGCEVDRAGSARGRLVGGNLSLLQTLIGTPYDWSGQGAIIFIEEVDEPLYRIERTLVHMRQAGKFEGARAVLVGEMVGILDEKPDLDPKEHTVYGHSLKDIVRKHVPPDIPLAFDVPCGHGKRLAMFPVGAFGSLTLANERSFIEILAWP